MLLPLADAAVDTCGGKAGALGSLLRAGLPVPDGFVVPFATYRAAVGGLRLGGRRCPDRTRRAIAARPVDGDVAAELRRALDELGDPPVAVRSSAANEDTGRSSAAGQHETVLAVRGVSGVADAVRACWASLFTSHAAAYRAVVEPDGQPSEDTAMAVIVQHHLDAEVSGVMFTPAAADGGTEIEASWGLGPSIVGGTVTPDTYRVAADATITRRVGDKRTRLDRHGTQLVTHEVPADRRDRPAIDDTTARRLAALGREVATVLNGPQDVEWAIAEGRIWILQARPVTAVPPPAAVPLGEAVDESTGTPASHGTATGRARIVRGPGDFAHVLPGDILVCPFTDPAWTPLLRIVAGVVTETGGVLSHAAIVARERGIPAVVGMPNATSRFHDGAVVAVDGTSGTVTTPTD